MSLEINRDLLEAIGKVEPAGSPGESLRRIVVERLRSEIRKYNFMQQKFEQKYQMDLAAFRTSEFMREASWEVEQDYFDWELAVTRSAELREELEKLASGE